MEKSIFSLLRKTNAYLKKGVDECEDLFCAPILMDAQGWGKWVGRLAPAALTHCLVGSGH